MSVYELAKKYYPYIWNENRLKILVKNGVLKESEAMEIIREAYKILPDEIE